MIFPQPVLVIVVLCASLTVTLTAAADNASAEDRAVPEVRREVLADLAGLDAQTVAVLKLSPQQEKQVWQTLDEFLSAKRPHLLTHRMIWAEMRERYRNLESGARANAFDPCEFVTDEALRDAAKRLRDARLEFEATCRQVHAGLALILEPQEMRLVQNAALNHGLPSPYRWLDFDDEQRKAVRRVVEVHYARRELVAQYPHLASRFRESDLEKHIDNLLTEGQREELTTLNESFESAQQRPTPLSEAEASTS
ncbi:MAG: hypothetical protein GVY24_04660 [Planctomycetes bacterium]|jgi:hypothetical protein|nr:hypothetical protein [Planctomycetota bacterium]